MSDLDETVRAGEASAIQKGIAQIDAKLEKLVEKVDGLRIDVTRMDERLKTTSSAAELAEIKGRVNVLPTTWQMITLVIGIVGTMLGGAFLILKAGLPHTPWPVQRFLAGWTNENKSTVEWLSNYTPAQGKDAHAATAIGNIYQAGLGSIRALAK